MAETTRLRLPEIAAAQAQKHVTHNEALTALDTLVQLSVLDKDLTAPPGGPSEGDCYIVADSATGDWTGWDGRIARYEDGAWRSYLPGAGDGEGWMAYVQDEGLVYVRQSGAWQVHVPAREGTWTPTVAPQSPGTWDVTYGDTGGAWVRTGNLVWAQFILTFTPTLGTGTGILEIGGLPFASAAGPTGLSGWSGLPTRFNNKWTWPTAKTQAVLRVSGGGSIITIAGNATDAGTGNFFAEDALDDGETHILEGSVMYLAGS